MITVAYTISDSLKQQLDAIEKLRTSILKIPLPLKTVLRLTFEASAAKTYYSLLLCDIQVPRDDVIHALSGVLHKNKKGKLQNETLRFYQGLVHIQKEWTVREASIAPKQCIELFDIACTGDLEDESSRDLKHILDYVQVSREHPVILGALIFILLRKLNPFTKDNDKFAFLLFDLFLYKNGWDISGFFVLSHYLYDKREEFERELNAALNQENLTHWLEYMAESIKKQLSFVEDVTKIEGSLFRTGLSKAFWKLTQRQKEMVSFSDIPNVQITNRKVQMLYGISQITASRDLAKLATLGLLSANGAGRSVYYTRF